MTQPRAAAPRGALGPAGVHRVLAVDDDPLVLAALRRQFEAGGYVVSTAADGIAALAAIHRDPPDVVLLDLVLPHLDGLKVCREVRRDASLDEVAILVVTSQADSAIKIEALRAGANDYVTKPFEPEELDARVRSHLKTKVLRDELRAMQERLVAGGKREAVIELAGAAAHEMNQPLTGILGRAVLLERKLDASHPGRRDLEIIREQAERLGRSVARLARVSSYDTTEYVGARRILDLEQASSGTSAAPSALALVTRPSLRDALDAAAVAAGLAVSEPSADEPLAAAWDRTQAEVLVLEVGPGRTPSEVVRATANQLSLREVPAVLLDPGEGSASSAAIEHLGAVVVDGDPPAVAAIETQLRRAQRFGRLLRRLEGRERELATLRTVDPLTGLARREHFLEVVASEVRRARRYDLKLALAVIDVDDFSELNRTWGEEIGNRVLRDLALTVRGSTREVDHLGRLGGELFGILLPHTSGDESLRAAGRWSERLSRESETLAESIRRTVEGTSFGFSSQEIRLTVSIGIAEAQGASTLDPEHLVSRAEGAVRRAKELGKNRVYVARSELEEVAEETAR